MKKTLCGNIFADLPKIKKREVFQVLIKDKKLRLERIISTGQVTGEGHWLKQKHNEWVVLLKGKAVLRFWGKKELLRLKQGEYVFIPKNLKHRVEWTDPDQKSVWLALHF
jgi:cupin 2 domain-containing protein